MDIAVPENTPVAAVTDGVVTETGASAVNGNYLKIETDAGYTVVYAHLNKISVKEDQRVEQGEIVAYSGNTGRSSGPHLHYGVYKDGVLQDPASFIRLEYTNEAIAEVRTR